MDNTTAGELGGCREGALGAAVGGRTLAGRPDVSSMTPLQLRQKILPPDFDSENLGKNWVGKRGFSKWGRGRRP